MNKHFSFFAVLIALMWLLSSCAKENLTESSQGENIPDEEIPAGFSKIQISLGSESVRTSVTDAGVVTWTNGDKIKFLYSGGSKTATVAVSDASSASVSAILPDSGDIYAVYPDGAGTLSGSTIAVDISSKPQATFAAGNYAVAKLNRSTGAASFCNVTAFLKLDVTSVTGITRIQIESPSGAFLGGSYDVTFDGYTAQTSECVDGDSILYVDVDGPGVYYVPVVPGQTHAKGLSFLYLKKEGSDYTQLASYYYETALTTEKNRIYNFGAAVPVGGHYYVSVNGSGNKSGFNAENAMTFARFKDKVTAYSDKEENNRARINQTKTLAGATFHFAVGTYEFPSTTPLKIGSYQSAERLDITLQGVEGTVFDGNNTGSIIQVNSQVNLTINDIAFANAHATATNAGGALYMSNNSSTLELNRCSFSDCTQEVSNGSGAALNVRQGTVTANDCTFTRGDAHAGGSINVNPDGLDNEPVAVFNNCTIQGSTRGPAVRVTNGTATFNGCTIKDNVHENTSNHGNLLCQDGAIVYVYGCTFDNNSSETGGAIQGKGSAQITIGDLGSTHTVFSNNAASKYYGGAVSVEGTASLSVTNVQFTGNTANSKGGAVDVRSSSECTFTNCTFDNNTSSTIIIDNASANVTFIGGTIENNTNTTNTHGALSIAHGNVTVKGVAFENNKAKSGGAIYVAGGSTLTVQDNGSIHTTFTGNQATSWSGGAINPKGSYTVNITNAVFTGNTAKQRGGAICDSESSTGTITLTGCTFDGNSTTQSITEGSSEYTGGAMQLYNDGCTINSCTFRNNTSKNTVFGGSTIYVPSDSALESLYITNSIFDGNGTSSVDGGVIVCHKAATVSFTECVFQNNKANYGGITDAEYGETYSFNDCQFIGNTANSKGGAIFMGGSEVTTLDFNNCTFDNNKATSGGAISSSLSNTESRGRFNNCTFLLNKTTNSSQGGGAVHSANANSVLYFNACSMYGNAVNKFGTAIDIYEGKVYMNNSTLYFCNATSDASGNDYQSTVRVGKNSGATFVLTNSCIFGRNGNKAAFDDNGLYSTVSMGNAAQIYVQHAGSVLCLINNIIASGSNSTSGGSLRSLDSNLTKTQTFYYNKMTHLYNTWKASEPTTGDGNCLDIFATTDFLGNLETGVLEGLASPKYKGNLIRQYPKYFVWNGTVTSATNGSKATLANVNTKIQTLAPDFYTWLNGLGVLNKDCRGKARGTNTWPGAYDGTNN